MIHRVWGGEEGIESGNRKLMNESDSHGEEANESVKY